MMKKLLILSLVLMTGSMVMATTYTDDFDREDSATLGPNWSDAFGNSGYGISSDTAAQANTDVAGDTYYNAVQLVGESYVKTSIEFQACLNVNSPGVPTMHFGLTTADGSGWGNMLYVQGLIGCKFFADGDWRDLTSTVALTDSVWYRMTIEQDGAVVTGTLSELDGTTIIEHSYTYAMEGANGYAFFGKGAMWGTPIHYGSPVFDNFAMTTTIPEPATMSLITICGIAGFGFRRKK